MAKGVGSRDPNTLQGSGDDVTCPGELLKSFCLRIVSAGSSYAGLSPGLVYKAERPDNDGSHDHNCHPLVAVVVAIEVTVMVAAPVPAMVVRDLAALAFPVTLKEAPVIMMRRYPACAGVRWTRPVSVVPLIVPAHWVPVARYPRIAGAGTASLSPNYTCGGGGAPILNPTET